MLCVGFSAGQKYDVYIYKNLLMFVETQFFFFFMLMFCLIAGVYEEQAVRKLGPFLFLFKISQGETYGFDVFFFLLVFLL